MYSVPLNLCPLFLNLSSAESQSVLDHYALQIDVIYMFPFCALHKFAKWQNDKMITSQNGKYFNCTQADIWSLGLIIFQMMFNCIPYKKQTDTDSRYGWLARGKLVEVLRRENPSTMPVTGM